MSTTVDETSTTQPPASDEQEAGTQPNQDTELFDRSQYDKPGLRPREDRREERRPGSRSSSPARSCSTAPIPPTSSSSASSSSASRTSACSSKQPSTRHPGQARQTATATSDVIVGSKTLRIHSLMRPAVDDAPPEAD